MNRQHDQVCVKVIDTCICNVPISGIPKAQSELLTPTKIEFLACIPCHLLALQIFILKPKWPSKWCYKFSVPIQHLHRIVITFRSRAVQLVVELNQMLHVLNNDVVDL
jgi:hypothetical protein